MSRAEPSQHCASGAFECMSFSLTMGGLSSLSLARIRTNGGRGHLHSKPKGDSSYRAWSSSNASCGSQDDRMSAMCSRSMSHFCLHRSCTHECSSSISVLAQSDVRSDTELTHDRLCSAPPSDDKSQGDSFSDNRSDSEEESPNND